VLHLLLETKKYHASMNQIGSGSHQPISNAGSPAVEFAYGRKQARTNAEHVATGLAKPSGPDT